MITVEYSDFTTGMYVDEVEAEVAILQAHSEGVAPHYITNNDTGEEYSLLWGVKLQGEYHGKKKTRRPH